MRQRKEAGERQKQGAHLEEAELRLEQAELPALEAGRLLERAAELHEVERRHGLQNRELVHQQLRTTSQRLPNRVCVMQSTTSRSTRACKELPKLENTTHFEIKRSKGQAKAHVFTNTF